MDDMREWFVASIDKEHAAVAVELVHKFVRVCRTVTRYTLFMEWCLRAEYSNSTLAVMCREFHNNIDEHDELTTDEIHIVLRAMKKPQL